MNGDGRPPDRQNTNNRELEILGDCAFRRLLPSSFRDASARHDDATFSLVHGVFQEFCSFPQINKSIHFPVPCFPLRVYSLVSSVVGNPAAERQFKWFQPNPGVFVF